MNVITESIKSGTLEEFANQHGLTIRISERKEPIGHPMRYYARFDHCEVKDGCLLISIYGNGATPEEAITEYTRKISMKRLIHNAYCPDRKEFDVWRLNG